MSWQYDFSRNRTQNICTFRSWGIQIHFVGDIDAALPTCQNLSGCHHRSGSNTLSSFWWVCLQHQQAMKKRWPQASTSNRRDEEHLNWVTRTNNPKVKNQENITRKSQWSLVIIVILSTYYHSFATTPYMTWNYVKNAPSIPDGLLIAFKHLPSVCKPTECYVAWWHNSNNSTVRLSLFCAVLAFDLLNHFQTTFFHSSIFQIILETIFTSLPPSTACVPTWIMNKDEQRRAKEIMTSKSGRIY